MKDLIKLSKEFQVRGALQVNFDVLVWIAWCI